MLSDVQMSPERDKPVDASPRTPITRIGVTLEVTIEGRPRVSTAIHVEGECERDCTEAIAGAVAAAVSTAISAAISSPAPPAESPVQASSAASAAASPAGGATMRASPAQVDLAGGQATTGAHTERDTGPDRVRDGTRNEWVSRYGARISALFGGLLLLLAVLVAVVAPPEQRGQVLIMTVLFGLTGALLVAFATSGSREPSPAKASVLPTPPARQGMADRQATRPTDDRRAVMRLAKPSGRSRSSAAAGLLFGLLFTLAGGIAPFVLSEGNANPDGRFLMVIGFSPVAISGALLVVLFWRALSSPRAAQAGMPLGAGISPRSESKQESMSAMLATVGVISGILLTTCGVLLPFVVSQAARADLAAASPCPACSR
jgi:hypothetical protein